MTRAFPVSGSPKPRLGSPGPLLQDSYTSAAGTSWSVNRRATAAFPGTVEFTAYAQCLRFGS
jgi:hypothetical protein